MRRCVFIFLEKNKEINSKNFFYKIQSTTTMSSSGVSELRIKRVQAQIDAVRANMSAWSRLLPKLVGHAVPAVAIIGNDKELDIEIVVKKLVPPQHPVECVSEGVKCDAPPDLEALFAKQGTDPKILFQHAEIKWFGCSSGRRHTWTWAGLPPRVCCAPLLDNDVSVYAIQAEVLTLPAESKSRFWHKMRLEPNRVVTPVQFDSPLQKASCQDWNVANGRMDAYRTWNTTIAWSGESSAVALLLSRVEMSVSTLDMVAEVLSLSHVLGQSCDVQYLVLMYL